MARRFRLSVPHPLVLLTACVILAAIASHVLPAGEYERRDDEATGRSVVVAGTYHEVEPAPVSLFDAIVALPRGMADAAEVIFLVFLIGGAFTVVDETGALKRGVTSLIRSLRGEDLLVIPIVSLFFATGGVVENMQEEIIPLIPVLLILTRRLGFKPMVAVAMSAGAAFVGSAFSPINPFQVAIAQQLAELPLASGAAFRIVFLAIALTFWIGMTMRYARRTRGDTVPPADGAAPANDPDSTEGVRPADLGIFTLVLGTFAVVVIGMMRWHWGFNELSAAFFIMGVIVGLLSGMKIGGTAEAYVRGFRSMAYAGLLIGFARAIYVVLQDGRVVDTIVHAMFTPLEGLPVLASSLGMVAAQTAIHVPVPSVSGQAVLTMPLLVPLSDLLGMSRQVTVLAYQYGAGLCELLTPTIGALMAILASAGIRYEDWIRHVLPLYLGLVALGMGAIAVALAIGLQ
ncbi:MAG: YfcC family protein [Gemmatimonadetes bacterium]|nr:YfcC family protein [Gemmatimonadota bacterium]MYA44286.1 YfcC family protein [Gemmatimonadota bacterium]MYE94758.1 YfcC family protein [Gemmatimonadota bacterium]MYJ10155.1 YfcC family protein [Gemmatimonadota bacterium]